MDKLLKTIDKLLKTIELQEFIKCFEDIGQNILDNNIFIKIFIHKRYDIINYLIDKINDEIYKYLNIPLNINYYFISNIEPNSEKYIDIYPLYLLIYYNKFDLFEKFDIKKLNLNKYNLLHAAYLNVDDNYHLINKIKKYLDMNEILLFQIPFEEICYNSNINILRSIDINLIPLDILLIHKYKPVVFEYLFKILVLFRDNIDIYNTILNSIIISFSKSVNNSESIRNSVNAIFNNKNIKCIRNNYFDKYCNTFNLNINYKHIEIYDNNIKYILNQKHFPHQLIKISHRQFFYLKYLNIVKTFYIKNNNIYISDLSDLPNLTDLTDLNALDYLIESYGFVSSCEYVDLLLFINSIELRSMNIDELNEVEFKTLHNIIWNVYVDDIICIKHEMKQEVLTELIKNKNIILDNDTEFNIYCNYIINYRRHKIKIDNIFYRNSVLKNITYDEIILYNYYDINVHLNNIIFYINKYYENINIQLLKFNIIKALINTKLTTFQIWHFILSITILLISKFTDTSILSIINILNQHNIEINDIQFKLIIDDYLQNTIISSIIKI